MVQFASGLEHPITILPAGGVTSKNVKRLVAGSGVTEVHGSFASGNETGDRAGLEAEIRRVIAAVS